VSADSPRSPDRPARRAGDAYVIALDVGGTGMKGALLGPDATAPPLHEARRGTPREDGPDAVVEAVLGFAAELRAHGVAHLGGEPAAAGVAVPGIVDEARGVGAFAANLGWKDVPLRALLRERLGTPHVALGHDMRSGGLAESRIGAGAGVDRFLFVALGTGIAGAIAIDGRIEPGADAAAAVVAGDPRAAAVWRDAVAALADGLVVAVTLLDPRSVIVGGGLAEAGATLFGPLRAAVAERLTFQHVPSIVPAALGDAAGCLGAGLLAWDLLSAEVASR
jgi:glucokinase